MRYRRPDQSAKPTLDIINKYNGASYSENCTRRPDIQRTVSCEKTLVRENTVSDAALIQDGGKKPLF